MRKAKASRYITAICPACFPAGIFDFSSWWEYEAFTQQLLRKPLTLLPVAAAPLLGRTACYECTVCREVWRLSEPEDAWRGYFLPLAAAAGYTRLLEQRARARRLGCGVVLLAGLLYIGWQIL